MLFAIWCAMKYLAMSLYLGEKINESLNMHKRDNIDIQERAWYTLILITEELC